MYATPETLIDCANGWGQLLKTLEVEEGGALIEVAFDSDESSATMTFRQAWRLANAEPEHMWTISIYDRTEKLLHLWIFNDGMWEKETA